METKIGDILYAVVYKDNVPHVVRGRVEHISKIAGINPRVRGPSAWKKSEMPVFSRWRATKIEAIDVAVESLDHWIGYGERALAENETKLVAARMAVHSGGNGCSHDPNWVWRSYDRSVVQHKVSLASDFALRKALFTLLADALTDS